MYFGLKSEHRYKMEYFPSVLLHTISTWNCIFIVWSHYDQTSETAMWGPSFMQNIYTSALYRTICCLIHVFLFIFDFLFWKWLCKILVKFVIYQFVCRLLEGQSCEVDVCSVKLSSSYVSDWWLVHDERIFQAKYHSMTFAYWYQINRKILVYVRKMTLLGHCL